MAPTLTILAPTLDRPEVLARVWPTWMDQQGLAEIVIVDDGSTKDYQEVFREMSEACTARSICLKVLRNNERRGAPAAKNLGLEHCTSQEILTTDDDILLPKSMVTYCREERPQLSTPVIVGPRVIYLKDGESEEAALARANQDTSEYFNYRTLTLTPWVNTGTVQAFPFVTAVALWPADLFKRGLRYHGGYRGNGYREETDPQLAACSDYSAQIFLVPTALCFHLPPSLAYANRSGQRRGSRLWFEFWVHYNNAIFIIRNRKALKNINLVSFSCWINLIRGRLGIKRVLKYFLNEKNKIKRPLEAYLAIFIFGYYMSYPVKVILTDSQASTLAASVFAGWIYVFFYLINGEVRRFDVVSFRRTIIVCALTIAALQVSLSSHYNNSPLILSYDSSRYIIYLVACIPMIMISKGGVLKTSSVLKYAISLSAIAYAISTILNSTYRLPTDLYEPLSEKYFVGPFLRAGAGYLDPNFLAINLIILMVFSSHFNFGKFARLIITSACVIGIFMTFSRAAWLITAALLLVPVINRKSFIKMGGVGVLIVLGLSIGQAWITDEGLLRRFVDEEGASSTADRLRQYLGAINELQNMTVESALFGIGGADAFFSKYGAHLHNYYLGAFISGGLLLALTLIITMLLAYYWTGGVSRKLIIAWFAMSLFLPNVPDTFYVTISIAVALGLRQLKRKPARMKNYQNKILAPETANHI